MIAVVMNVAVVKTKRKKPKPRKRACGKTSETRRKEKVKIIDQQSPAIQIIQTKKR